MHTCRCVLKLTTFVIPSLAHAKWDRRGHRREGSFSDAAENISAAIYLSAHMYLSVTSLCNIYQ